MIKNTSEYRQAEHTALRALTFLAEDQQRIEHFMDLTGLSPADLQQSAAMPEFLAGVLDYMLNDETLLHQFAESYDIAPDLLKRLRYALPGATIE